MVSHFKRLAAIGSWLFIAIYIYYNKAKISVTLYIHLIIQQKNSFKKKILKKEKNLRILKKSV